MSPCLLPFPHKRVRRLCSVTCAAKCFRHRKQNERKHKNRSILHHLLFSAVAADMLAGETWIGPVTSIIDVVCNIECF